MPDPAAVPGQAAPAAAAPPAEHPGPLTRMLDRFLPRAEAGVHDAEAALAAMRRQYRAHAGEVFDVARLALAVAEQIDPKDAPVIAELEQKAISLAVRAASIASAVLAA